jgi:transposase
MKPQLRFLKTLPDKIEHIKNIVKSKYDSINLYCQDESRFGLFTRNGRALTVKGVKPICPYQHKFDNTYLYGAFSPINGQSFIAELPRCDTDWFEAFLDEFSRFEPQEYKIIVLDNGAFHKAQRLIIPDNITLIFLPPYSPELNPAEKIWQEIKKRLVLKTFKSLKELQSELDTIINSFLTVDAIKSITGFSLYQSQCLD